MNVIAMASRSRVYTQAELEKQYEKAMRSYVRLVEQDCDLVREIKHGLISEQKRQKICDHRVEEMLAHNVYIKARRRLWRFLDDWDSSWPEREKDHVGT